MDNTLRIEEFRPGEAPLWDAYVDGHPRGTLFHRSPWRDLIQSEFGFTSTYLKLVDATGIRGVLPLFDVPQPWGKHCTVSVPFAVYGGLLADEGRHEKRLLEAAETRLKECGGHYLELRHRENRGLDSLPGTDLYITFIRDLPDRPEDCIGLLPRKARAAARQARKRYGLEAVSSLDVLDSFPPLFSLNKQRLGSPSFRSGFFRKVVEMHGNRVGLFTVVRDGVPVSAVIYFVYRDTILPYFSGSAPGAEAVHASNFMYMALMEHGVRLGLKRFDFGRSRRGTGSARFKEHQGFEATPLHYRYILNRAEAVPSNNPSNPRYDRVKRIWSKLPRWLARLLGPRLIRYFP